MANVVVGATSAVELTGTALAAAGMSEILGISVELLAGFTALSPWGLLFSVGGGLVVAGSTLLFDLTAPWNEQLSAIESALDAACTQEVRGKRFRVSERLDLIASALDR